MIRLSILLFCVLGLSACSHWRNEAIQELTVETPGAQNALCHVYVDGLKYKFRPPQTQVIIKSNENLTVDCFAPGNRRRKIVIKPKITKSTYGNVVNAGVGAAWDMASKAAYQYPSTVYVDFTYMELKSEKLPSYNNPDIKQPEEYKLEEFLPSTPRLNSDMEEARTRTSTMSAPSKSKPAGKGDLMDVIKQMF